MRDDATPPRIIPAIIARLAECELEWERTANPIYVWYAIGMCTYYGVRVSNSEREFKQQCPYPTWVQKYLAKCAERIDGEVRMGADRVEKDVARLLPGIFGFREPPGRGSAFSRVRDDHMNEILAETFAAAIIVDEQTPPQARAAAAERVALMLEIYPDDKTLARRINKFFGVGRNSPQTNAEWLKLLVHFCERRDSGKFLAALEGYISRRT